MQYSVAARNAELSGVSTTLGASSQILLYTGAIPANVAAAASGTLVATFSTLTYNSPASGSMTLSGTATATAGAANTGGAIGYFRAATSGGTAHVQGLAGMVQTLATSAATAANNAVLTFGSAVDTTKIAVNMGVSGTGVPSGATVAAISGSTVTLSAPSTGGVASAATITFSPEMTLDNFNVVSGQSITLNSLTLTAAGA
jgi:hypothetical protein